jgi:transposase
VRAAVEKPGAALLFLPLYSSDFNTIEMAFSMLETHLGHAAERTFDGLWNFIGRIVYLSSPQECPTDFAAAGYDAN